ncbi:MAG: hypothetical protein LIO77_07130 [Rikenellaceae bacterium]|nr:hypothetical protein [Rikenellaceae bacterium]
MRKNYVKLILALLLPAFTFACRQSPDFDIPTETDSGYIDIASLSADELGGLIVERIDLNLECWNAKYSLEVGSIRPAIVETYRWDIFVDNEWRPLGCTTESLLLQWFFFDNPSRSPEVRVRRAAVSPVYGEFYSNECHISDHLFTHDISLGNTPENAITFEIPDDGSLFRGTVNTDCSYFWNHDYYVGGHNAFIRFSTDGACSLEVSMGATVMSLEIKLMRLYDIGSTILYETLEHYTLDRVGDTSPIYESVPFENFREYNVRRLHIEEPGDYMFKLEGYKTTNLSACNGPVYFAIGGTPL